jgi:DNA-binding NarL/FixJ family response regulator
MAYREQSTIDLAGVWSEICAGRLVVATQRADNVGFHVVLVPRTVLGAEPFPLSERSLRVLRSLLLGEHPMLVAMEMVMSQSTVAWAASRCLAAFGVRPPLVKSMPMCLSVAAHAAEGVTPLVRAVARDAESASGAVEVQVPRFDFSLREHVTHRAFRVARHVVEGGTLQAVAATEGVSARTAARDLSEAFSALGVSSRAELISKLIRTASVLPNSGLQQTPPR